MNPVIKWSGSKRSQASRLIEFFPEFDTYYEPFLGGGSVLYHVLKEIKPTSVVASDICKPLIDLWLLIQSDPKRLILSYTKDWTKLQNEGHKFYYEVRERFNKENNPEDLFFLSRTCVNGLIRFNKNGEFNNSYHHTRKGINPNRIAKIVTDWSNTVSEVKFKCLDYRDSTKKVTKSDFIYLDPPYFNTRGRYYGKIDYSDFVVYLERLNKRGVKYALSFDGMRGNKVYLKDIPKNLFKHRLLLESGNSSFKKVMDGESQKVLESVYLNF